MPIRKSKPKAPAAAEPRPTNLFINIAFILCLLLMCYHFYNRYRSLNSTKVEITAQQKEQVLQLLSNKEAFLVRYEYDSIIIKKLAK